MGRQAWSPQQSAASASLISKTNCRSRSAAKQRNFARVGDRDRPGRTTKMGNAPLSVRLPFRNYAATSDDKAAPLDLPEKWRW